MSKKKTTKPSGLGIALANKKFSFSWKIADKNYKDGQQLYYEVTTIDTSKAKGKRNSVTKYYFSNKKPKQKIGTKVTSKTTPAFNWDNYYPKRDKFFLSNIKFYVRGKRDGHSWSPWSDKSFSIVVPPEPSTITAGLSQDFNNVCTFSWGYTSDPRPEQIRSYWQYRTGVSNNGETNVAFGAWQTVSNSYVTIKEDLNFSGMYYSYTRRVQVRAVGPIGFKTDKKGNPVVKEAKWVYAYPNQAKNVAASASPIANNNGYAVSTSWTADNSATHPVDQVIVEYAVGSPASTVNVVDGIVKTSLTAPTNPSWTAGGSYNDNAPSGKSKDDTDRLAFTIDRTLGSDECIFIRVNTYHNPKTFPGNPIIAKNGYGSLADPDISNVTIDSETNIAKVTVTKSSSISSAFIGVYYRTSVEPNQTQLIGIIPAGQTVGYFKLPELKEGEASIGVRAFVGDYTPVYTPATGSTSEVVSYSIPTIYMQSREIVWQSGTIAPAPKLSLAQVPDKSDTVRAVWEWNWPGATEAEISWASEKDAWESTNEPSKYIVDVSHSSQWNIANLSVGIWYFRVRLLRTVGDSVTYGTYSSIEPIKLASSPATPALYPTSAVIPETGSVTLSWAYVSTDGTSQIEGEMCEAEIQNDGTFVYGKPFARSGTAQSITVSAAERGWKAVTPSRKYLKTVDTAVDSTKAYYTVSEVASPLVDNLGTYFEPSNDSYIPTTDTEVVEGKTYYQFAAVSSPSLADLDNYYELSIDRSASTHYVAVSVTSASREKSAGWSAPVPITIADPPSITLRSTSLVDRPVIIDDDTGETVTRLSLTEMPFTVNTTGAGESGKMTYIIERAEDYHIDRPDESEFDGYNEETIAIVYGTGEGEVSITNEDLVDRGSLDDGAKYNLVITLEDQYGQTAISTTPFWVYWNHQALEPDATVSVDEDAGVVMITPNAPKRYFRTTDGILIEEKNYYTISEVLAPTIDELSTYYEADPDADNAYIVTQDTDIVSGKTYYIGTVVAEPVAESIASYYEMGYPGDSCDIYRLSVDRPELIVKNAIFGTTYVDPYPTLGRFGGHRIVYRTANGDYIIGDNTLAMTDYGEEQGDIIDRFATIVTFGNNEVVLPYNLKLSNSWTKDFTETKYLGGSIRGDWNPTVSRKSTVNTTTVAFENPETIEAMRRLAVYPGLCHIQTPEGSSFAADVSVSEDREEKMINKIVNFTLSVTKVNSENLDGVTYNEWVESQNE